MNPWHLAWIIPVTAVMAASAGLFVSAIMFAPDDDEHPWLCSECENTAMNRDEISAAARAEGHKEGHREGWDDGWRECAVAQLIEASKKA